VALRQGGVTEVTVFYRRTRHEMPAYEEEIEDGLEEGLKLESLTSPIRLHGESGRLTAAEFITNALGEVDASGRRRPVAKSGSEYRVPLDTLIVAIGEEVVDVGLKHTSGIEMRGGTIVADKRALSTGRRGVFAGGDVATGPNTVVDAIAAGRRAADVIHRYLQGQSLLVPAAPRLPTAYLEPGESKQGSEIQLSRVEVPALSAAKRKHSFAEVEATIVAEAAAREANRCLRCDLEFTTCPEAEAPILETSRGHT